MYLTTTEIEQFYGVWFPLLHFVNQQLKLAPSFPQEWQNAQVPPEVVLPIRNALWEHDDLREQFIAKNPANLSQDDLDLVASWKHRVAGQFFLFRYLKSYSVFINSEKPVRAYGVLGIHNSFEDFFGNTLPVYLNTVLIPFGNRTIYDSLLSSYPVFFGGGIKSSLNDTYRRINEREGIITDLSPAAQIVTLDTVKQGNKKVLQAFQKDLGRSGLSPKKIEEHRGVIESFADDFLAQQTPPAFLLDVQVSTIQKYQAAQKKSFNKVSFKRFARFSARDWTYRL